MLLGSHVSMKGKEMFLGSAKEAFGFGENTFMTNTGAPQNTIRKPIDKLNIPAGKEYINEHGISHVVIHAPYVVNLANNKDLKKYNFEIEFFREEIQRAEALGAVQLVLHPGSHVGLGTAEGIKNIAQGLNEVITKNQKIQISLETMAGKGTEIGQNFEQLAAIIEKIKLDGKVSVTLDTCHANDAGYDIKNDFKGVLKKFDDVIGLERLKVVHLNDSKNPCGSHKDRHANIGFGTIGFKALNGVAHCSKLTQIPKILETPFVKVDKEHKYPPYAYEIKMLKEQRFDDNALKEIIANKGKLV